MTGFEPRTFLVSEATGLPSEPQPLPKQLKSYWKYIFGSFNFLSLLYGEIIISCFEAGKATAVAKTILQLR